MDRCPRVRSSTTHPARDRGQDLARRSRSDRATTRLVRARSASRPVVRRSAGPNDRLAARSWRRVRWMPRIHRNRVPCGRPLPSRGDRGRSWPGRPTPDISVADGLAMVDPRRRRRDWLMPSSRRRPSKPGTVRHVCGRGGGNVGRGPKSGWTSVADGHFVRILQVLGQPCTLAKSCLWVTGEAAATGDVRLRTKSG